MKPQEFKPLQTVRLDLKPLVATFDFANELFNIISRIKATNPTYFTYVPSLTEIENPEQEFDWLRQSETGWKNQTRAVYGLYLRDNGEFIGICTLRHINWRDGNGEIAYWIRPEYTRQGFISEAVSKVTQSFFDIGFSRFVLTASPNNLASCGVAKKCGFEQEGIMRKSGFNPNLNKLDDAVLFAKIKD
jgi:RimJ/RimL family protein N-acetyltransferase